MAEETPKEAVAEQPKPDPEAAAAPAAATQPKSYLGGRRMGRASMFSAFLVTLVVALGIITLVVWLIYRPHRPRAYVDSAAIYDLNVTDGSVTSNMQFSVLFQNPNRRWTIRYDSLLAFVVYRDQLITMATPLPSLYQDHRTVLPVFVSVAGSFLPVYPQVAVGLLADEAYGLVELRLELRGRLRWRASLWKSAHYHLHVRCDLLVGMKNRVNGQVPLYRGQRCHVDI
ncbi:hypothetical protein SUGI_1191610 [Cryptomeria japonica]|uniref:NDR1/HIN1-like protein 1 n=1 Tax=Cryptomeria japonica TaxID=3369 RepID=UPI002414B6D5|nr:NDR1/HIN1-like protein 1 [Cryptomeria japonica]GLJ55491.1 hypothetical protein SUGI_1191610 [Cryptomeria japonica]